MGTSSGQRWTLIPSAGNWVSVDDRTAENVRRGGYKYAEVVDEAWCREDQTRRIVEALASKGNFDLWLRLQHLDGRNGTTEARDAIFAFIAREFAPSSEQAAEDGGEDG